MGIFALMWRQAGGRQARAAGLDIPVRSALIAAFVGGLSGEYFYGGVTPLSLILITPRSVACPILQGNHHDDPRLCID